MLVIATLRPRVPTPDQRTRASSAWPRSASGCAPSVNTCTSARGSAPTRERAVRTASSSRLGMSRGCAERIAETTRSRSRVNGASTLGWMPASMTIASAPSPSRLTRPSAARWAWTKRVGEVSVAFMEAELSSTTTMRLAPWPITVTVGRASARDSAISARICKRIRGSRCSRWKKAEASRSRRADSQRSRLDTVRGRRRTFRKYSSRSGTASVDSSSASGERKLMRPGIPSAVSA